MAAQVVVYTEDKECNICASTFNKRRKQVCCPKCQFVVCRGCFERYTLDHITVDIIGTTCMSCKSPMDFDFISANTSKNFTSNKWKEARKEVLYGIEIAKLPTTQESARRYIELKQNIENEKNAMEEFYNETCLELNVPAGKTPESYLANIKKKLSYYRYKRDNRESSVEDKDKYKSLVKDFTSKRKQVKKFIRDLAEKRRIIQVAQYYFTQFKNNMTINDTDNIVGQVEHERNTFIMPCPYDECKGFLSTRYSCGICNRKICSKCNIKITDGVDHECDEKTIETVKMIRAETKPCPKCGARIYKTEGCDQMYCIACHTAFSWNTGRIVIGERIHNPEYFRWMREHNRDIPRVEDQMAAVCNGDAMPTYQSMRVYTYDVAYRRQISNMLQKMEHYRAMINDTIASNRDLRIYYLINQIDKDKLRNSLMKRERVDIKTRFMNGIYRLISDVIADILRRMTTENCQERIDEVYELSEYVNKQCVAFSNRQNLKIREISIIEREY